MEIDEKQVRRLEELARIELAPEERARTARDLQDILSYMAVLSSLYTANVEPYGRSDAAENVFREDLVLPPPGPEAVLSGAPEAKEGQFKAPKTFE